MLLFLYAKYIVMIRYTRKYSVRVCVCVFITGCTVTPILKLIDTHLILEVLSFVTSFRIMWLGVALTWEKRTTGEGGGEMAKN